MKPINITMGNDHRLRVAMTRWDAPLALLHSSDVKVYALRSYGSRVALVRHFSSHDEGVLEAFWPSNLVAGIYGLEITGVIEGEGQWRMLAENAICVTAATEKGGESLVLLADSFDVKATITVCEGTKGVDQELRDEIADMIEEEYNASERVREENEFERQQNEIIRQQNEQSREQAEGLRQQTFETNEAKRQQDFDDNEAARSASFTESEGQRQSTFETNEAKRQKDFDDNEAQRQAQAAEDHGQYESDHSRAAEDHQTASDDHANEQQRIENEQGRVSAEEGRVSAEEQREETFATYGPILEQKMDGVTQAQFDVIFYPNRNQNNN